VDIMPYISTEGKHSIWVCDIADIKAEDKMALVGWEQNVQLCRMVHAVALYCLDKNRTA
jgi:hypothetical protein